MRRATVLMLILLLLVFGWWAYVSVPSYAPINVGILHSLHGTMAISEQGVVDATLLAIEEINERGGVLGRPIHPIIADGHSDWPTFAREAKRLIEDEQVSVVFGCWTSASRKTVLPIFESYRHLLIYPLQYEGLEQSPHIVYTGAAPNQQIIPAITWGFENLGTRFFLVGSDYIFPHMANMIISDHVKALGGKVVGETYLPLGSHNVTPTIKMIQATQPDVIVNTINGDTNLAFFRGLRAAGIQSHNIPSISFSIAETELAHLDTTVMEGEYAAWNYFQSIPSDQNRAFVERFRARYGADRVISDPMESAYVGVYLWAQAVEDAGTDEVALVRQRIRYQSFHAPHGIVSIDPLTQHTWKTPRIGRITSDGQFEIVWSAEKPVRPLPYPISRSPTDWDRHLMKLYRQWDGYWENPVSSE